MVSLLLRYLGKSVDSNDCQLFNQTTARVFLGLSSDKLRNFHINDELLKALTIPPEGGRHLVRDIYDGIFFTKEENIQIDNFCQNIDFFDPLERDILIYAVGQALMKKRPYNLFHRANLSMRQKDVKRSFGNAVTWETSIYDHACKGISELRKFHFQNDLPAGKVFGVNTRNLSPLPENYDLIYLDPPYLNSRAQGVDYSDFYGFLDGLCDYSLFETGDTKYPHKPIAKKECNWLRPDSALNELTEICKKWRSSVIFFSYRSDGLPTPDEAKEVLALGGRKVEIHSCGEYKYALSTTNTNEELFLISLP